MKEIKIGKFEVKLCLFTDDMILYVESPKESSKKKTVRANKHQIAGHKINIQNSVAFLYTLKTKQSEKEIKKTMSSITASKG